MLARTSSLIALLATAGLVVPVSPGPASAAGRAPTCHGHRATIVGHDRAHSAVITGTRGRDVIVGTRHRDVIHARGGNDIVCGRGGADWIYGGRGDDRLSGGRDRAGYRAETESAYAEGDTIEGGPGDDLIDPGFDPGQTDGRLGHVERDTVSFHRSAHGVRVDLRAGRATGDGHDRIVGRPGFVWVRGSSHDDRILGSDGPDQARLGEGDDVFRGRGGDDLASDGSHDSGTDRLHGGPGDDTLLSTSGADLLVGGRGDDTLTGDHAWPISPRDPAVAPPFDIRGGPGDDRVRLTWIRRGDRVSGGDGADVLGVVFGDSREERTARADLAAGTLSWGADTATTTQFEKYYLNTFAPLTLHGSDGPDLVGYAAPGLAADLGAGDDLLTWQAAWSDFARDDASDDRVDGGPGTDTVDVGEGNDTCTNVEAGPC